MPPRNGNFQGPLGPFLSANVPKVRARLIRGLDIERGGMAQ